MYDQDFSKLGARQRLRDTRRRLKRWEGAVPFSNWKNCPMETSKFPGKKLEI